MTSCGYDAPDDPFREDHPRLEHQGRALRHRVLQKGFYKKLLEATQGKDPVTCNIVLQILQDEVEHEEDLQTLSEDLEMMMKK